MLNITLTMLEWCAEISGVVRCNAVCINGGCVLCSAHKSNTKPFSTHHSSKTAPNQSCDTWKRIYFHQAIWFLNERWDSRTPKNDFEQLWVLLRFHVCFHIPAPNHPTTTSKHGQTNPTHTSKDRAWWVLANQYSPIPCVEVPWHTAARSKSVFWPTQLWQSRIA